MSVWVGPLCEIARLRFVELPDSVSCEVVPLCKVHLDSVILWIGQCASFSARMA